MERGRALDRVPGPFYVWSRWLVGGMENTEQLPSYDEIVEARERNERERLAEGRGNSAPGAVQSLEDEPVDPTTAPPEGMQFLTSSPTDPQPYPVAADEPDFGEDTSGQIHLVVEGKHEKLNTTVEGRTPTSSSMRITGGKVEVAGQYQPGDRVSFLVTVVVDEVTFKDEKDSKTGQVVGRARNHRGYIAGIHEES